MSNNRLTWATSILQRYQKRKEYGDVTVKFENGRIVHVEEKKNRKPPVEEPVRKN